MKSLPFARIAASALALAAFVLSSTVASAHAIGLSTGEYTVHGASIVGKLAFARREVMTMAPNVDTNHDGHLTAIELETSRTYLRDKVLGHIEVSRGGERCTPTLTEAHLLEQDGLLLSGRWDCKTDTAPFELDFALLDVAPRGHRHIARTVSGGTTHDEVLDETHRKTTLPPMADTPSKQEPARPTAERGVVGFFTLGIEHILTGYDHLVFLLGLVLARSRLRSLLAIVTAFTVAHSLSLACAALGVWVPSPRIVEPAIALSIAYVGIENFFVNDGSHRWRIALPFGLIHGFGFAGALRDLALPRASIPSALVPFNLGVELGQLAVLAVLLPLAFVLRKRPWFAPRGERLLSGAVALAGSIWFVARIVAG